MRRRLMPPRRQNGVSRWLRKFEKTVRVASRALLLANRGLGAADFGPQLADIRAQIINAEWIQRQSLEPLLFCRPNFFVF
jgi:hypothetical protein